MIGVLSCALGLVTGTIAVEPALRRQAGASASEAQASDEAFHDVRVEVVGFDAAELIAALRLRMPRLPVALHDGSPPSDLAHVYLRVAREADGTASLRVITSDGRAFERSLAVDPQNEIRVAASMAANLIFAAEQRTLQPDREHVPIPAAPTQDPPDEPPPDELPVTPPPVKPRVTAPEPKPRSPAPRRESWEWAVSGHGAAVMRLGPPQYGERLVGAGAGLGAELRGPRGGSFVLELRGVGRRDAPLTIGRLRVGLGGGYALRRGRFELPLTLAIAVEPWWVDNADGDAVLFNGDAEARRRPLFGGYLRASPGVRLGRPRGSFRGVRVGPRLELGGEMLYYDGPVVGGLADATGTPHFRLGGLELSLGLEVAVYFGAPARR